jgi:MerR-like DNA binding protein
LSELQWSFAQQATEILDLILPETKDTPYSHYRVKRMDEQLTIGDLAKATGTKVVTVRYYEQAGLLPAPPRTSGNYRTYG